MKCTDLRYIPKREFVGPDVVRKGKTGKRYLKMFMGFT